MTVFCRYLIKIVLSILLGNNYQVPRNHNNLPCVGINQFHISSMQWDFNGKMATFEVLKLGHVFVSLEKTNCNR